MEQNKLSAILQRVLAEAKQNSAGEVADYIPELAQTPPHLTNIAVTTIDGQVSSAGDNENYEFTLQSVAKLVVLCGLLEDMGDQVFNWVGLEPSSFSFCAIPRLDEFGPMPANPLLNAGAITLCSHIPGRDEEQLAWLNLWNERLFGQKLNFNAVVFASERLTGDRNRSIAYLLKSNRVIKGDVDKVLDTYFSLCSFEANIRQASRFAMILANRGCDENGKQVLSATTVRYVNSIMATCGLYNATGRYMVHCGMPAKSGVSGLIIAAALGRAGVAVYSPRISPQGNSVRGTMMLEALSKACEWHFAT